MTSSSRFCSLTLISFFAFVLFAINVAPVAAQNPASSATSEFDAIKKSAEKIAPGLVSKDPAEVEKAGAEREALLLKLLKWEKKNSVKGQFIGIAGGGPGPGEHQCEPIVKDGSRWCIFDLSGSWHLRL